MPKPYQEHTVASYDEELTRLASLIAEMGGMAEARRRRRAPAPCSSSTTTSPAKSSPRTS